MASSFLSSFPQIPDFNYPGPIWSHRSSQCSNPLKNSTASSLHKIEVMEMEIRRANPGFIGKAKLNTIKITVALVGAFLTCWTPYYFMCIWYVSDDMTYDSRLKVILATKSSLILLICLLCATQILLRCTQPKLDSYAQWAK